MHYWQGEWVDDAAADKRLDTLADCAQRVLAGPPPGPLVVLNACDRLGRELLDPASPVRERLVARLREWDLPEDEVQRTFTDLASALDREALERKVLRELGDLDPARLARFDLREPVFEAWVPVGLLVHFAPGNAPAAGALSALEGLLAGNLNVVKTSGDDSSFTAELLAALAEQDVSGTLAERLIVLRCPSSRRDWLVRMCEPADAAAAWGGEEALAAVAELLPAGCRLIDWGPKLSFAYLTADTWTDGPTLAAVAADVCRLDQQACSSPQVIYLDTADKAEVFAFAERFAPVLAEVGARTQPREPSQQEWAEITNTVLVTGLEQHLGLTKVIEDPDGGWRVLADTRSALRASPLYRTVWVKPLPRNEIAAVLRPMRRYLQTVGLAADRPDTAALARLFVGIGAQRITMPGEMLSSYHGEPHDGVYALQRYSRRVDVQLDKRFRTDACLDDLIGSRELPAPRVAITGKGEFEQLQGDLSRADVFFHSGGSSGKPKLSAFSWDDYHEHMRFGAEGLLAAGLDPSTDRVMNLFYAGHLYGGFTSFFSTLEVMGAKQFPMGAQPAAQLEVAQSIVDHEVDTLVGMPSNLFSLFTEGAEILGAYRGVRKIFYGGEHFSQRQRDILTERFGVEVIRSAVYGSVDGGPLGYQCEHSPNRVHHLFTGVHTLEIIDAERDEPVGPGQTGRLVFTAHTRRGQRLDRYEIGDLGRWLAEPCPCGRRTPRFELLGRTGDVFRIGPNFLNYRRFVAVAEDFGHTGALQIVLGESGDRESLTIRLERGCAPEDAAERFFAGYEDLRTMLKLTDLVSVDVELLPVTEFDHAAGSGKLRAVVDTRTRNT
ncbi:acyl-CoA reductase [Kutzneria sp. NPDC052558]|uniref:acyl-CoA reductase n=1 Tax=Kutzneria sp. NPDC052558 TaxID=3364121 RepID=UPI0037C53FFF